MYLSNAFVSLERRAVDERFAIRGSDAPDPRIAMVAIDNRTFDELKQAWPLRRSLHAKVIDKLKKDGARVIAYDIQFSQPSVPAEDNALIDAVSRARNVVLAATEVSPSGVADVFGGAYRQIGAQAGSALLPADGDDVIRRMPFATNGLRSFAVVAAAADGSPSARPSRLHGKWAWIDYAGPPGRYPAVSFVRVLRGQFRPGTFRGKIVVVGPTAPSLQDIHATPTATSATNGMSGAEVQTNAIATVLRDFPLRGLGTAASVALIFCLGLVAPLATLRFRPAFAAALTLGAAAVYVIALQIVFQHGLVLPASYPLLVLIATAVGAVFVDAGLPQDVHARRPRRSGTAHGPTPSAAQPAPPGD